MYPETPKPGPERTDPPAFDTTPLAVLPCGMSISRNALPWLAFLAILTALPSRACADAPATAALGDVTLFSSGEGTLMPRTVDGKIGWAVSGGSFLYGDVKPVRSSHLRLTFGLHDGGVKGIVGLPYDSSDETVSPNDPHPGAWKRSGLALPGTGTWTAVSADWPDARLAKGCNGHDFRMELPGGVTVGFVRVQELAPVTAIGPQRLPLAPLPAPGAIVDGGSVRLPGAFVQEENAPLVFNAADATVLSLTPGRGFGADGGPAGGVFIQNVDTAEYEFTVKRAGLYQLWERAWFPGHGYNHEERLEDGQGGTVVDDTKDTTLNQWVWVKARTYPLTLGGHRLTLSYHGGARLDRLAFTRDLDTPPTGDGGRLSRNAGPSQAVVETADAAPLDVAKWLSVEGDAAPRGGEVKTEASSDGGATWSPLPANGDLTALPVHGNGKDRLRLRFTLRSAPDGSSPILQGYQAVYREGPHNEIVLAGKDLRLAFGPTGLRRLHSVATGTDFLWGGSEAPLFALCVKPPGSAVPVWVPATQATVTGRTLAGDTLTQRYHLPLGIVVTCRVRVTGGSSRWGLDIVNGSKLEVCAAQYPMLQGVRVGPSSDDNALLVPDASYQQLMWDPIKAGLNKVTRSPAMHWTYLYNGRAGLYLGDENWPPNDLLVTTLRHDPTTLQYGLTREFLVAPGQRRDSPDYVVDVRPGGDWHPGADVYRAWAAAHLKRPFLPEWTRRMDGWIEYDSNVTPNTSVANMGLSEDYGVESGLGAYMGGNRLQADGPIEYVGFMQTYCPAWGSLREYQDALREVRELGGHPTFYFNWQLTSPAREVGQSRIAGLIPRVWVEQAPPWHDGGWYAKTAWRGYEGGKPDLGGTGDEMLQGIASPTWQQHHYDRTKLWVQTYGTDGMYFDQLNVPSQIASIAPEYNKYGDYGVWERAVQDNLAHIAGGMRKTDPHFVTSGELCNAVIGQTNTFAMTSGIWNHYEVFRYCLPHEQNLDGNWNGGIDPNLGGVERWRLDWMTGARFEVAWTIPYLADLITLRRRVNQLLYAGTYQDTAGLTLSQRGKAVANPVYGDYVGYEVTPWLGPQAKWFLMGGADKGAVVNVILDPPAKGIPLPLTVSIPIAAFGPVRVAWALGLDGTTRRLPFTQTAGRCSFTLPGTQKATSVLLVGRVGPQVTGLTLPFAGAPGAAMTGRASVVNYNAAPERVALSWQTPAGWHGTAGAATLTPGRETPIPVGLALPPSGLGRREDLTLTASSGLGLGTYPHWVTITDPLWVRLFRLPDGRVEATVFNRSDKALDGTVTLSAPEGVTLTPASLPFHATPWSRTAVQARLSGLEAQQTPVHVAARAVAGGATAERTLMVYPPAADGGFEADSAGDGQPDWWHSYGDNPAGYAPSSYLDSARLDPDRPHSGKYCLRLDPHPISGQATYAEPIVHAIDAGHKYHLRVAVRKTDAADDAVVNVSGRQSLSLPPVAGQWSWVDCDFTTNAGDGDLLVQFVNKSRHPVWFDDLSVQMIP